MGSHLPASLGLCAGALVFVLVPTGAAAAAGQECMGVVVDDAGGVAPSVQAAEVAPGTSDLQALSDVGQVPTLNAAGLVCVIGGYPADGLQNCLSASNGQYYFWSYWEGDPSTNTWTYASVGPASHTVANGQSYVEGWRYQNPGPASPAASKPAVSPAAAFAQACPGGPGGGSVTGGGGGSPGGAGGLAGGAAAGGSGASPGGATTPAPSASGAAGGAATSPSSGTTGSPAAGGGPPVSSATAAPTGAAAGRAPSGGATTPSPRAGRGTVTRVASASAGGATASSGPSGVSPLPVIMVSALVGVMGAFAWVRWRRRSAVGQPGE